MTRTVLIGGGVGGLTTAALLARAGLDVTVLEAHSYPGGSAGTFFHQGYRFDAGATLPAGFYPGGPMDLVAQAVGIEGWPVHSVDSAMIVHLPDGTSVTRYAEERRWEERQRTFGPEAEPFWRWQEKTSDALWDLALQLPAWPPQTPGDLASLAREGLAWLGRDPGDRLRASLALDALRPMSAHLRGASRRLRLFVDAQLLISSQTTSSHTNALYGASALDLPRRGVAHAEGGMGAIAGALVEAVQRNGGQVHLRQEATRIAMERGRPVAVETNKGASFSAEIVIANLTPWNVARLLGEHAPREVSSLPPRPRGLWGAFMLYVGLDGAAVPSGRPLHHQVIVREPMGNANTVFLSLSPEWDVGRAPEGRRAMTVSTHTDLNPWWDLHESDRSAYEARKQAYTEQVLAAAEVALPNVRDAAHLILPGTPVTFQRFARRDWGWVGGFPQTSLMRAWGPRLTSGLWLVGDSIFPGQSVPAVALGGLRVAGSLLAELGWQNETHRAPGGARPRLSSVWRRIRFLSFLAGLLLAGLVSSPALAHQPFFEDEDIVASQPWQIDDPSISTALYATLDSPGDVDYYSFEGLAREVILLQLTIPQIEGQVDFAPTMALIGPGLPEAGLPDGIARDDGAGVLVIVPPPGTAPTFYEPFSRTSYWERQEQHVTLPAGGRYVVAVWHPQGKVGRYTFVIGEREKLGGDLAFPLKMRSYWTPVEVPVAEFESKPVQSRCGVR